MSFRPAVRAAACTRWYSAISAAVNAPADHPIKLQAAESRAAAAMPPVQSLQPAAAVQSLQSAAAPSAEMVARRQPISGSSRRRLDIPAAGDAVELQPRRTMRTLSRLVNASKRTFSSNALQPVSIY